VNQVSIFPEPGKIRVLVAPLDWGLGHATRCIPIIKELHQQGCEVIIAAEGPQESLFRKEFPFNEYLHLKGYNISYGSRRWKLFWQIFRQIPKMLKAIHNENKWLKKIVTDHSIDAVISDNRYGLSHAHIPCVFITHQLCIKSPFGKWSEKWLQIRNYKFINRFTCCWVPDFENNSTLAGDLSHPQKKPSVPVYYTGILSRLEKSNSAEIKGHLFISLSGPEPQRTIFENIITEEVSHYHGTATIVRGLPGQSSFFPSTNDILFYNHLEANDYAKEMAKAEYVICRSGYSTIMDIAQLNKKSILIPTPGQTEQEYLARYLSEKKLACSFSQKKFRLNNALRLARQFDFIPYSHEDGKELKEAVSKFIQLIISRKEKL
jgi:uncharacterized protein (TIGR00661 family)